MGVFTVQRAERRVSDLEGAIEGSVVGLRDWGFGFGDKDAKRRV